MLFIVLSALIVLALWGIGRALKTGNATTGISSALLLGIIIGGVWLFGPLLTFFTVYPLLSSHVQAMNVAPGLAAIIAMGMTVVFIWSLPYLFTANRDRQFWGVSILAGLLILDITFAWQLNRNRWFSPQGVAVGRMSFDPITQEYGVNQPNGHDRFGQLTQEISPQAAIWTELLSKYPFGEVPADEIRLWFDPQTNQPLVWVSFWQDRYHCYLQPGYDPVIGVALEPVKPEVVLKIVKAMNGDGQDTPVKAASSWWQQKWAELDKGALIISVIVTLCFVVFCIGDATSKKCSGESQQGPVQTASTNKGQNRSPERLHRVA